MSILDDLQDKITASEERFGAVLDELQGFAELKKSLESADDSLIGASENIQTLASSLSKNADALLETVAILRETITVINKTNPVEVVRAYSGIENKLVKLEKDYGEGITLLQGKIKEASGPFEQVANDNAERLSIEISEALNSANEAKNVMEASLKASSEKARNWMNAILFLIVLDTAAVGFLLLKTLQ